MAPMKKSTIADAAASAITGLEGLLWLAAGGYGEQLQRLAEQNLRDYDLLQGHLSDVSYGGGMMALYALAGHLLPSRLGGREFKKAGVACIAVLGLLVEVTQAFGPEFTSDVWDLVAYAGGAAVAYVIDKGVWALKDRFLQKNESPQGYGV